MHANNSFGIFGMRAGFPPVAWRKCQITLWQFFFFHNLIAVITHHRYFRRAGKIISVLCLENIFRSTRQMSSAIQMLLADNGWSDKILEFLFSEKLASVIPDRPGQLGPIVLQKISAKAVDFYTPLKIHHIELSHQLHMVLRSKIKLWLVAPGQNFFIIFFSRTFGHRHVWNIWHLQHYFLPFFHCFF